MRKPRPVTRDVSAPRQAGRTSSELGRSRSAPHNARNRRGAPAIQAGAPHTDEVTVELTKSSDDSNDFKSSIMTTSRGWLGVITGLARQIVSIDKSRNGFVS